MDCFQKGTNRREFLKTVAYGAGGCALGTLLIQPEQAFGEALQVNLAKVPMEARWAVSSRGLVNYQMLNFKALLDRVGRDKFVETVKKRSFFLGGRSAGLAKKFGFNGDDAKSFAAMSTAMVTLYYGPKQAYTIDATPEKATITCTNCVFWNLAQAQKIKDDLCSTNSQFWWSGLANGANPKLSVSLVKARPLGNPLCEWAVELNA